jgi:hypothetical protein
LIGHETRSREAGFYYHLLSFLGEIPFGPPFRGKDAGAIKRQEFR